MKINLHGKKLNYWPWRNILLEKETERDSRQ